MALIEIAFAEVLDKARKLQRAYQMGHADRPLRGKHIAVWCETDERYAEFFRQAAQELGAAVARIQLRLSECSTPQEVQQTARALGLLYNAVECQVAKPAVVQRLGTEAPVPVYDGLATDTHPTARLAGLVAGDEAQADGRRLVLQAALLCTIV
jgi:ornithine carbamoyltransferase